MRQSRFMMVQTLQQYKFLYESAAVASQQTFQAIPIQSIVSFSKTTLTENYCKQLSEQIDFLCAAIRPSEVILDDNRWYANTPMQYCWQSKDHVKTVDGFACKKGVHLLEIPKGRSIEELQPVVKEYEVQTIVVLGDIQEAMSLDDISSRKFVWERRFL